MAKKKLIRLTTVPISLKFLIKGQMAFMQSLGYEVVAVSSPGPELDEVAHFEGIRTKAISMTRSITPFHDILALWYLYHFFRKECPEIVHTHTPKAGLLGMLAAWFAKVPIRMHTVAGIPWMETKGLKRIVLKQVERITYNLAHRVFPNSYGLLNFIMQQNLCDSTKIKVIGAGSSNGINLNYFKKSEEVKAKAEVLGLELGLFENNFVYIFIGRLVGDKGVKELINAFIQCFKSNPNLRLLLVGNEEPELDPLPLEVKKIIALNSEIIQCGFQNDIRPYLALSHCLVLPSYREGFPNVPLQALALEVPVIVSDINGCNEIVEEEVNGLMVPAKSVSKLIETMIKMQQASLWRKMKRNSRESIKRYDQKRIWKLLEEEYSDLLDQNVKGKH